MIKVVLADDEKFVRQFLRRVGEALSFKVIAEVEKGDDVYQVVKNTSPDILFLDINMPNYTGLEFLKNYAQEFPKTCIIILTSASSFQLVEEVSRKGAYFIRKDTPIEKMLQAIQKAWIDHCNLVLRRQ